MPSTLYNEGWKEANSPVTDYVPNYLSLLKKKKTNQPEMQQSLWTMSVPLAPVPLSHPSPKLLLGDGREHNSCHRTRTDEVLKQLRALGAAVEAARGEIPVPGQSQTHTQQKPPRNGRWKLESDPGACWSSWL